MTTLTDHEITALCRSANPMLYPFVGKTIRKLRGKKCISYGLDSMGYDLRLVDGVDIFSPISCKPIDPLNFDKKVLANVKAGRKGYFLLPPGTTCLGKSAEYFRMPKDVTALIIAKSTYARCGVSLNATHANPGWEGELVIEITNQTPLPVRIYVDQGIAHAIFFKGNIPKKIYSQLGGKYQGQKGVTLPMA